MDQAWARGSSSILFLGRNLLDRTQVANLILSLGKVDDVSQYGTDCLTSVSLM
ncbi:hypothetical protein N8862_00635 [Pseudomonadales bacterium]|nr:hypothetical protein [Pseudomonadales bacterium]